jgi:hypothetical protein
MAIRVLVDPPPVMCHSHRQGELSYVPVDYRL